MLGSEYQIIFRGAALQESLSGRCRVGIRIPVGTSAASVSARRAEAKANGHSVERWVRARNRLRSV